MTQQTAPQPPPGPLAPVSTNVPARPARRKFTKEDKLRILGEADAAWASGVKGAVGSLLRREAIYSSTLTKWRGEAGLSRSEAVKAGQKAPRRGPKPRLSVEARELDKALRENERLRKKLELAEALLDFQKKTFALIQESEKGASCR